MRGFLHDEGGSSAMEYALIASLISIAAIVLLTTIGQNIRGRFEPVATTLS